MHILFNVLMEVTAVEGPDGSTSIRMSGGTDPNRFFPKSLHFIE